MTMLDRVRQGAAQTMGVFTVAMVISLSGCLRDNPRHCANQGGDAFCHELFQTVSYCSRCTPDGGGCSSQKPTDACHVPSGEVADGTSSATEGESESMDEEEGCETCPQEAPHCYEGECVSCASVGDTLCEQFEPDHPFCHDEAALCVACLPDRLERCPSATPFCSNAFTCSGCTEHAECPDSACDIDRGTCFASSRVFWVDNGASCPGEGTKSSPYCDLKDALDEVEFPHRAEHDLHTEGVVKIVSSSTPYGAVVLSAGDGKRLALVGVGDSSPTLRDHAHAVRVGSHRVYVSNLTLSHNSESALRVSAGGRVWVDDSVLISNAVAVDVLEKAQLALRRVRILGNAEYGVIVSGESLVMIESSVVANNGSDGEATGAIKVDGDSSLEVNYTTIAHNRGAISPSIECLNTSGGSVRNSIVIAPALDSIRCTSASWSNDFVDSTVHGQDLVVTTTYDPGWFLNVTTHSFRPVPGHPFADVAQWELGDPLYDLVDKARTWVPGHREVAGALLP